MADLWTLDDLKERQAAQFKGSRLRGMQQKGVSAMPWPQLQAMLPGFQLPNASPHNQCTHCHGSKTAEATTELVLGSRGLRTIFRLNAGAMLAAPSLSISPSCDSTTT